MTAVLRNAVTLPKNSQRYYFAYQDHGGNGYCRKTSLPQDGRINIEQGGRDIDLRISTLPTILGEKGRYAYS